MIIFGNQLAPFAQELSQILGAPCVQVQRKCLSGGEIHLELPSDLTLNGHDITLVHSLHPSTHDAIIELLLLSDMVRRSGGRRIRVVAPYIPYARQDKSSHAYESAPLDVMGQILKTCGIHCIISLDIHSKAVEKLLNIEVHNVQTDGLFVPIIRSHKDILIVAPDAGGTARTRKIADALGAPFVSLYKKRSDGKCTSGLLEQTCEIQGKNCFIIDDIIASGETLVAASHFLYAQGAKAVHACVTHGVWDSSPEFIFDRLTQAHIKSIYITDSIKHLNLPDFINVLPATSFVSHEVKKYLMGKF